MDEFNNSSSAIKGVIYTLLAVIGGGVVVAVAAIGTLKAKVADEHARVERLESQLQVIKREAIQVGAAYWEVVDENATMFRWKDPNSKLPEYQRPVPIKP